MLRIRFDRDKNAVSGSFDPQYVAGAVADTTVSVPASLHDSLRAEFGDVRYTVRLGPVDDSGDHLHANAYPEGFNRLTLGGRGTVELYFVQVQDDLKRGYVRPIHTKARERDPSSVDLN
jgi:hypothetical protein